MPTSLPQRQTLPPVVPQSGYMPVQPYTARVGYYHQIDPTGHYARSQKDLRRIPLPYLRAFVDTLPVQAAITRITDGVTRMLWSIEAPDDKRDDPAAIETAERIEKALKEPNCELEGIDNYTLFISSIVTDLLTQNVAAIERAKGGDGKDDQAFWLWITDPGRIELNLAWSPQVSGQEPRYYDTRNKGSILEWKGLADDDLFLIKRYANSWRIDLPGPIEIAFKMVAAWLGLSDFQQASTSRASQEYLLDVGPASQEELEAFRTFFEIEVLQNKKTPILGSREGSRGINVVKLGASNDSQLYLQYYEKLLRIIALAFKLTARDYNEDSHDNRATAGVAADSTFQDAILPTAQCIVTALQKNVIGKYFPGFTLRLADTEPRDQLKEAQTSQTLYAAGIVTLNEARLDSGKESLGPSGDKFVGGERLPSKDGTQEVVPTPEEALVPPPQAPAESAKPDAKATPVEVVPAASNGAKPKAKKAAVEIQAAAAVKPVQLSLF